MPCPYFYPTARLEDDFWAVPPRLPLGDAYRGECRAAAAVHEPDEATARTVCNAGYARGRCDHFPASSETDAMRYNMASDAGGILRIQYIFESRCWPRDHGVVEYPEPSHADPVLCRQASAFAESYLRRVR